MLSFPVHPRYARMFLAAKEFDCVRAAALIAALTQSRNLLLRAERRVEEERAEIFGQGISDFLDPDPCVFLRPAPQIPPRRSASACHPRGGRPAGGKALRAISRDRPRRRPRYRVGRCDRTRRSRGVCLAGFADQVARRRSGGTLVCDIVHGRRGQLARSSVAQNSRLVVAAEINEIEGRGGDAQVVLSLATAD